MIQSSKRNDPAPSPSAGKHQSNENVASSALVDYLQEYDHHQNFLVTGQSQRSHRSNHLGQDMRGGEIRDRIDGKGNGGNSLSGFLFRCSPLMINREAKALSQTGITPAGFRHHRSPCTCSPTASHDDQSAYHSPPFPPAIPHPSHRT
jgi:hypothetical protein